MHQETTACQQHVSKFGNDPPAYLHIKPTEETAALADSSPAVSRDEPRWVRDTQPSLTTIPDPQELWHNECLSF